MWLWKRGFAVQVTVEACTRQRPEKGGDGFCGQMVRRGKVALVKVKLPAFTFDKATQSIFAVVNVNI